MATLATQIATNYAVRVGAQTRINTSRGNSGSVSQTEDAARTTAYCEDAADWVAEALGGVDGSDTQAVRLGVRYALFLAKFAYQSVHSIEAEGEERQLTAQRDRIALQRQQGVVPNLILDEDEDGETDPDPFA